jgi:hypothetical protein
MAGQNGHTSPAQVRGLHFYGPFVDWAFRERKAGATGPMWAELRVQAEKRNGEPYWATFNFRGDDPDLVKQVSALKAGDIVDVECSVAARIYRDQAQVSYWLDAVELYGEVRVSSLASVSSAS